MTESSEFDVTLGGQEHLPFSANSLKFAASRSVEIAAMTECILRPSKTKLIFQKLPIHMRRRVTSHNAKRLPRRYREGHLEQLKKSGEPPKQKRPSRKYRRRPANLLQDYNRRQKQNIWLETHIWHAKRFQMVNRWGYRIANAPCDKAFRACYRASSKHCLIQDLSYYTPVQISGPEITIKEFFSFISSPVCGLGVCAKAYVDGKRQGLVHLYNKGTYPFGYIGKVEFVWSNSETNKCLWLFIHPSQSKHVEALLTDVLSSTSKTESCEVPVKKRKIENIFSENIQIKFLPGTFNRFRLTGPKSHGVLTHSLKCLEDLDKIKHNKWISVITQTNYDFNLKYKSNYWNGISNVTSPSQLPSKIVVGLIVRDPRLCRPKKRKIITNKEYENINVLLNVPSTISNSPLWDCNLHNIIKEEMLSNSQFIEHITKTQLIPGEVNMDDPALQSVPIVLIQRPGSQDPKSKKLGFGGGWDVITPPGYSLPFWHTFIMFGARSGGLREAESLAFEMGHTYLPPDSDAGKEEENRIHFELREKYFRLPPSKRVNYIKMAIVSPFNCPWNVLLREWGDTSLDLFVLRDRKLLSAVDFSIKEKKSIPEFQNSASCLIPIYVRMVQQGNLKNHAIICLPESNDMSILPKEPLTEDKNEKLRSQKRRLHLIDLKKLKKKRSKLKKKGMENSKKSKKLPTKAPSEYVKTMRDLWLPPNVQSYRNSCSRQIMGCLTKAGFSFTESCSCGIGYVAYNALNTLLNNNINQVLVRNTSSRQYRLATISVIRDE